MNTTNHQFQPLLSPWRQIVCLIFTGLALVGCNFLAAAPTPKPVIKPDVVLKTSGSGSVTAVLAAIAPDFEAATPSYHLNVLSGTDTGGGVKGVAQGVLDVAAMSRALKDEEAAQNVKYLEYGRAGVATFSHPGVGVANLTADQLKAIFSGQITTWDKVGGPKEPIIVFVRDEADSSAKAMHDTFMGDTPYISGAQILNSQGDMLKAVETTNYSIGYGTWPVALAKQSKVAAIKIDGIGPDDPAYPMLSPQGIGYLSTREAEVKPLLDWLLSPQGKESLHKLAIVTP